MPLSWRDVAASNNNMVVNISVLSDCCAHILTPIYALPRHTALHRTTSSPPAAHVPTSMLSFVFVAALHMTALPVPPTALRFQELPRSCPKMLKWHPQVHFGAYVCVCVYMSLYKIHLHVSFEKYCLNIWGTRSAVIGRKKVLTCAIEILKIFLSHFVVS